MEKCYSKNLLISKLLVNDKNIFFERQCMQFYCKILLNNQIYA